MRESGRQDYRPSMEQDDTIKKLLALYSGPVPRYTSYPPATQFRPAQERDDFCSLLSRLPIDQPLSLYFHIPFCRSLCSYCGCMTRVVHGDEPIQEYVRMLEKELNLVVTTLSGRYSVNHIHFGGGSPNLLLKDDLNLLLNSIKTNFSLAEDAEIAMEVDPRHMSVEKARDYKQAGINRVSIGVQDFQEKTQKAINRIQPFSQIEECVGWLREAGISRINFDLMYGLPYQTDETIADNIQKAITLGPDRIALFGYAHVPWMKTHQKILDKYALPDSVARFSQAEKAREILLKNGYLAIGMDHFSKASDSMMNAFEAGTLKRNFQGYTNDDAATLLGFGLSAISRFSNAFVQNTLTSASYKEKLEKGSPPADRWMVITDEDRLRADVIETLMCYFSADCEKICQKHGFPKNFLDNDLEKLTLMERDGLVSRKGRRVTLTRNGAPFVRTICACFDAYYEEGTTHHARAI